MISPADREVFYGGVRTVEAMLPFGESDQAARGIGMLAASIAHVQTPEQAYAFVDRKCFELDLSPEDAYEPWSVLGFLGVQGAVDQMRVRTGITESSGVAALKEGIKVADVTTGNFLIGLVAAGDRAVKPLARQHIIDTVANKELIYVRPRRAYKLYQAGDQRALRLTIDAAEEANAYQLRDQQPNRGPFWVDNALLGLATTMIKQRQIEDLEDVLNPINDLAYRCRIWADVYAGGLSPDGQAAEEALAIASLLEDRDSWVTRGAFNALVAGGFEPMVQEYKRWLIDKPTRIPTARLEPDSLVALYKGGVTEAADRLVELAKGENPIRAFIALEDIGMHDYVYRRAAELYAENPSRTLLKTMLSTKFTTEQWKQLWSLRVEPVERTGADIGLTISFRAKDVRQLAEHLSGTEIQIEPK